MSYIFQIGIKSIKIYFNKKKHISKRWFWERKSKEGLNRDLGAKGLKNQTSVRIFKHVDKIGDMQQTT